MSGTDDPTHVYWDLENRKGLWAKGEAMSGCAHMNPAEWCASCIPEKYDALREENARLRAEIGEAGSPPPLGSWRQRAMAAEAKLAKVVEALRGQATRLLPEGGVCFCDIIRDECVDEPSCVEAREALAAAKGES